MKIAASITPNKTKFGPLLFPGELEIGISELSRCEYDGIELSLRTPADVEKEYLFNLLDRYKLELLAIATGQSYLEDGLSLFHHEKEKRAYAVERIKGYIDFLDSKGSVILGGIKGTLDAANNRDKQYSEGCEAIDECIEYAEKKGITLLLEAINRYETNLFNTIEECINFVNKRRSKYLKILPDTFHMNIEEASIKDSLNKAGDYIGAIHCADSNRCAPGMGHINFSEVLSNVGSYKNLQYLGVEILPLPNSRKSAEIAINTIKEKVLGRG